MCDMNKMQKIVCKIRSKQGHHEFSPNNDENKSISSDQIASPIHISLPLFSRPKRDTGTPALRELG